KLGKRIDFTDDFSAKVVGLGSEIGGITPIKIKFSVDDQCNLGDVIQSNGLVPLPPYIHRDETIAEDEKRYQTVYADLQGSVAAPTAGLHFTNEIFSELEKVGCEIVDCTLHVGAGTFLPVKNEDINQHKMHFEWCKFGRKTIESIIEAKKSGRSILAIGTTAFRAIESFAVLTGCDSDAMLNQADSFFKTDLFIKPMNRMDRFRPKYVDQIITNFHQPQSTLLMLISALLGYEQTMAMYRHAVDQKYRLFSYGDSSLLQFAKD
ncbi:S-adenosylmethionine:tRNA ribosyltransferase-isomerase, partial [Oligoflexaceae bacterium]|nr:S-adenosylmethionine:tRNA ribosyltransferase-isomerase [Oligoflexaceae bacterium]